MNLCKKMCDRIFDIIKPMHMRQTCDYVNKIYGMSECIDTK